MTDNDKAVIAAVINTLDSLTVTGSDNMSKVLGCINALQKLLEGTQNG